MDRLILIDSNATDAVNEYDDFVDDSIDFGDDETLDMQPFVQIVGQIVLCAYIIVIAFGIPANIYVLYRMRRLARIDHDKYTNGTGVGLLAMATADVLALILISVQNLFLSMPLDAAPLVKTGICKGLLFLTHTVTSVSIWSWLLMSTLRYLAVKHPLYHLRLWRMPYRAVAVIIILSSLTNAWLLVAVDHDETGCTLNALFADFNRYLFLIETFWSFCIPFIMIIYMDAMVLICQPHKFVSPYVSPRTNAAANQRSKKAKSTLWKWLLISFIDVLLNTPENVYRLLMLLSVPQVRTSTDYEFAAQMIAQMLYFSQFAFNSVYLALFVFDKSTKPRTISAATHTQSELSAVAVPVPNATCRRQNSHKEKRSSSEEATIMLRRHSSCHQLRVTISRV